MHVPTLWGCSCFMEMNFFCFQLLCVSPVVKVISGIYVIPITDGHLDSVCLFTIPPNNNVLTLCFTLCPAVQDCTWFASAPVVNKTTVQIFFVYIFVIVYLWIILSEDLRQLTWIFNHRISCCIFYVKVWTSLCGHFVFKSENSCRVVQGFKALDLCIQGLKPQVRHVALCAAGGFVLLCIESLAAA